MRKFLRYLLLNTEGQSLVEYSLIIAIVVLATIGAITLVGEKVSLLYQNDIVEKLP